MQIHSLLASPSGPWVKGGLEELTHTICIYLLSQECLWCLSQIDWLCEKESKGLHTKMCCKDAMQRVTQCFRGHTGLHASSMFSAAFCENNTLSSTHVNIKSLGDVLKRLFFNALGLYDRH